MNSPDVGMALRPGTCYPVAPFHPPELYPEFDRSWLKTGPLDLSNLVYPLVREALFRHLGGYDAKTNQVDLSVLQRFSGVKKIVVKPNWVFHQNKLRDCVTTHASVLRPLLDYLLLAFNPTPQIIVADIPLQSANIEQIWEETGVDILRDYYRSKGLPVDFMDLRREKILIDSSGFIHKREPLLGDVLGYIEVSLGNESYLEEISCSKSIFSVDDYEPGLATCYHRPGQHRYLIPKAVLASDLFVNLPKLKTHCKAGITACMKNLIGINGEKGWIPHYRTGAPYDGGDEYPDYARYILNLKNRLRNALQERNRRAYHFAETVWKRCKYRWEAVSGMHLTAGGAWPGNDTLWRSILDLVRVITFADHDGKLMDRPQRHHLCLIDGIICGEGEGPLQPSPKAVGLVLCSSNPVSADWAACHIAGFDWTKIPQLYHARTLNQFWEHFPESSGYLTASWSAADPGVRPMLELPVFPFKPPSFWVGHIEADLSADLSLEESAFLISR
jgi:uncharacterized protein (DUF362 family)